jgi:mannan endo-1,4-beta-mannosidase
MGQIKGFFLTENLLRFLSMILFFQFNPLLYGQSKEHPNRKMYYSPADPYATTEAKNVFANLKYLVDNGYFIFGQEFPTDFQWSKDRILDENPDDSDCKDVLGQHPGVFGSDFHYFLEGSSEERSIHLRSVRAAHNRGALITFDWHLSSPVERGGSFYVNDGNRKLLEEIDAGMDESGQCLDAPNGMCTWYFEQVDKVLELVKDLRFTIIFRPLHEMSGFWFWWGNLRQGPVGIHGYNTFAHRYKRLYRSLVEYTRAKGAHNLLYAWSPSNEANFDFYPGDNWVDIVGLDIYEQGTTYGPSLESFRMELSKLTRFADDHQKIAVLAETGFRMGYPDVETKFWTEKVLAPLTRGPERLRLAWVLTWMNAQWERSPYIPYRGMENQEAIADFRLFYQAPQTLFEGDFVGIETTNFKVAPLFLRQTLE